MIATVVVTGKVKVGFITIPDRVPGCALQINIRSLFEVVAVEVTDIFSTTIDITVDSFAAIDVIRQRLQIGGGTDKPGVVLRAAAPAQKFIGGGTAKAEMGSAVKQSTSASSRLRNLLLCFMGSRPFL